MILQYIPGQKKGDWERVKIRRQEDSQFSLQQHYMRGKYGPIFACCVCGQHNFRARVQELGSVPQALARVNTYYTEEQQPHLYRQLGKLWVCTPCRKAVARGTLPALAVENGLAPTWLSLPDLGVEEHQLVALEYPLYTLHNVTRGLMDSKATSRTLFLPNTSPDNSSLPSLLCSLHCRTKPPVLRPEVLETVAAELLISHPLKGGHTAVDSKAMVDNLQWTVDTV